MRAACGAATGHAGGSTLPSLPCRLLPACHVICAAVLLIFITNRLICVYFFFGVWYNIRMGLVDTLKTTYPEATCELVYGSDFELLIAVILSAQCTDKRVKAVTEELFRVANTPEAFCAMPLEELEDRIRSCGLYKNKAANIKRCCEMLVEKFGGDVPRTMSELITLPGVGRKTANVMLSVAFDVPAIAVDTHVFRVAHRLGLSVGNTPDEVERDLCAAFDPRDYRDVHFLFIRHGRDCCHARKPDCENCSVGEFCADLQARSRNAAIRK